MQVVQQNFKKEADFRDEWYNLREEKEGHSGVGNGMCIGSNEKTDKSHIQGN